MLNKNQAAPDFSSPNQHNQPVSLSDFRDKKHVVLYFYPKDDTPGCTIEANQFTTLASEFARHDAEGDKPVITWDPPAGWQWPLEVGKSWTESRRVTIHASKTTIPFEITQKVEAYEDVTVPAGTFKAFRISTVNTLGDQNVIWFSPEHGIFLKQMLRRTDKHRQGPGTQNTEVVCYKRGDR